MKRLWAWLKAQIVQDAPETLPGDYLYALREPTPDEMQLLQDAARSASAALFESAFDDGAVFAKRPQPRKDSRYMTIDAVLEEAGCRGEVEEP